VTHTFRRLPALARAYVTLVVISGAVCLVGAAMSIELQQPSLFALLLVLAVAMSAAKIELPLGRISKSNLSLSHAITFWALFSLGPAEAVCIAAVSAWAQCTLRVRVRNPPHRTIFNVASLILTVAAAGLPLSLVQPSPEDVLSLMWAATVVAPVYFFANSALVAVAIALSTHMSGVRVWQRNFMWSAPSYFSGAALAAIAAAASTRGWFGWVAALAVPGYLVFRSYHTVVSRMREEQDQTRRALEVQLATIEALALAIEAKAGCTPEHIRAIQQYAGMLAEAASLPDADVQAIRTAALLHDIGNMAVPEHILAKPDKLTAEEFERVKIHPRVGADILRNVPFGAPVAELVLAHHERWDGLGYPQGMRGGAIPIGARILAIADCFSALQTDRPYRPARSEAEAIQVLRDFSGASFDPALVDLFVQRLHSTTTQAVPTEAADAWTEAESSLALRDIAGAHREEQTLYEVAQVLGSSLGIDEAMAQLQEKVSRVVPFSTLALFLGDEQAGYTCRYASGPGTEALMKWEPRNWSELSLRLPSNADGRGAHGEELTALLPCPLLKDEEYIGALVLYHTVPGCFTDDHRRILGRVSEQAAAVITNANRFEQTQHESHTDPLTGLANRRSLSRQVEAGLVRASQAHGTASVIVLDLDRLKEINDTYGHDAGDRALRAVGSVLKTTVRQSDVCARFAGDEFVAVLWDCTPEYEARRVYEMQSAVAAFPFEPRPGVVVSLSISAGPARFPADGRTFEELLAVADERMYRDKAGRRARATGRQLADQDRAVANR
jgi:diguanylate cyclase (GGDEF)-like protein/putative nucleotidyltransferase with HDIG domain